MTAFVKPQRSSVTEQRWLDSCLYNNIHSIDVALDVFLVAKISASQKP